MNKSVGIASLKDVLEIEASQTLNLPSSTYEMIRLGAAIDPKASALSFFLQVDDHKTPEVWTYQSFLESVNQTANFFAGLGVDKDKVVAYILPNLPETHFVVWGGQAAGIVAAINPLLEPEAIAELLNAAGVSVLVTLSPFPGTDLFEKVSKVLPQVPSIEHLVLVNLCDRVRGLKKLPAKILQASEVYRYYGFSGLKSIVPESIDIHDFGRSITAKNKRKLDFDRVIDPNDYSSFFCTGGTTGTPKIAMRTHRNEVSNAWSASQILGDGVSSDKTMFCGLPLFHVNGVLVTGLVPFSKGAHVVLGTPQGYRGEGVVSRFWEIVERHKINFFSGVPTLYASLLDIPIGTRNISSLEYGLCGAAPMPVEVFSRFQENTGLKILEGYGLTEATCVSSTNPPKGERRLGSIGLRTPGQMMKAVILDDAQEYQRDCRVDEVGVIAISGPNVFSGYKVSEQNKCLWIDTGDGRKWLNSGDLGRQDAEGYFWLTGRKKELIIRGGHNIDPATIEEPLHRHPSVMVAAAVGRPDVRAGELPVAYVQLKPEMSVDSSELLDFASEQISERAAVPKSIHIIDEMPLTGVGKIFKPELKKREIKDAISSSISLVGITIGNVSVEDDKTKGMTVSVSLMNKADEEEVRSILGRFPFSFSIHV